MTPSIGGCWLFKDGFWCYIHVVAGSLRMDFGAIIHSAESPGDIVMRIEHHSSVLVFVVSDDSYFAFLVVAYSIFHSGPTACRCCYCCIVVLRPG